MMGAVIGGNIMRQTAGGNVVLWLIGLADVASMEA